MFISIDFRFFLNLNLISIIGSWYRLNLLLRMTAFQLRRYLLLVRVLYLLLVWVLHCMLKLSKVLIRLHERTISFTGLIIEGLLKLVSPSYFSCIACVISLKWLHWLKWLWMLRRIERFVILTLIQCMVLLSVRIILLRATIHVDSLVLISLIVRILILIIEVLVIIWWYCHFWLSKVFY